MSVVRSKTLALEAPRQQLMSSVGILNLTVSDRDRRGTVASPQASSARVGTDDGSFMCATMYMLEQQRQSHTHILRNEKIAMDVIKDLTSVYAARQCGSQLGQGCGSGRSRSRRRGRSDTPRSRYGHGREDSRRLRPNPHEPPSQGASGRNGCSGSREYAHSSRGDHGCSRDHPQRKHGGSGSREYPERRHGGSGSREYTHLSRGDYGSSRDHPQFKHGGSGSREAQSSHPQGRHRGSGSREYAQRGHGGSRSQEYPQHRHCGTSRENLQGRRGSTNFKDVKDAQPRGATARHPLSRDEFGRLSRESQDYIRRAGKRRRECQQRARRRQEARHARQEEAGGRSGRQGAGGCQEAGSRSGRQEERPRAGQEDKEEGEEDEDEEEDEEGEEEEEEEEVEEEPQTEEREQKPKASEEAAEESDTDSSSSMSSPRVIPKN